MISTRTLRATVLCAVIFEMLYSISVVNAVYSHAKETEIRKTVLNTSSYDSVSRPEAQTHIKVGLNVLAIDELSITEQKLTMAGWLTFNWTDNRTGWEKSDKDDIEYIFTQSKDIWKPELVVDNAISDLGAIKIDEKLLMRIKNTGEVDWELPTLFSTHCQVDISYYPYDEQKCAVEIVSLTYTIEEVELDHLIENVNLKDFEENGEWEITRTEIEDKNLTDSTNRTHPRLDFWIYMKRRKLFYNLHVLMPMVVTSLMVALVFIVPVGSGEKLSYVLTLFLSLIVFLTIVAELLPPNSITLSVLGLYLGLVVILAALGILITVLILIMYNKEGKPKKDLLIVALARYAARVICWNSTSLNPFRENKVNPMKTTKVTASNVDPNGSNDDVNSDITDADKGLGNVKIGVDIAENDIEITWKSIARILDRFCFYLFLMLTFVMNFSFVVALATGGRNTGH